jgi:two-component sensor histidine kinase
LGQALHELESNARKHGSLSWPEGSLTTSWSLTGNAALAELHLRWVERAGPPVAAPTKHGFGRHFIENRLGSALGGQVRLAFEPAGVTCDISFQLQQQTEVGYGSPFGAGNNKPALSAPI